jgi:hypothetical protein
VEYSTSTLSQFVRGKSRNYEVHQHMNEWASRGWRLVTASCRNLYMGGPLEPVNIEYVFFWERNSRAPVS